jgi:hypothetical protein
MLIIVLLLAVSTVAKIAWASNSIGTTDVVRFFHFSEALQNQSIAETYATDKRWNQTFTVSLWMKFVGAFTKDNGAAFVLLFRLPGIIADVFFIVELLLLRERLKLGWGALAFAAISPIHLLVSGFHGNLDSVMALFVFLAFSSAYRGSVVMSAIWLGVACHVKIPPVLFAPALAAFWMARGNGIAFVGIFGTVAGTMLAGGVAVSGLPFVKNVLAYGSIWGSWGIGEILVACGISNAEVPLGKFANSATALISQILKICIIVSACALAWIRRSGTPQDLMRTAAATSLIFFTLTPGFGHQYLVWWLGPVLVATPRIAVALTIAASLTTALAYQAGSREPFPWNLTEPPLPQAGINLAISLAVWSAFVAAALFTLWRFRMPSGNQTGAGETGEKASLK